MTDPEFVYAPIHAVSVHEVAPGELEERALTYACDFCLDVRVRWQYPCDDFVISGTQFAFKDEWLACDRCADLIDDLDHVGLRDRSERSWVNRGGSPIPEVMSHIGVIQDGFFDHMTGDRQAFG